MFENTMIVQSAVSAFNNAALVAPSFLWTALLTIPLFVMVYFYGGAFVSKFGWNAQNILSRVSLTAVIMMLAWVVLFGGNYAVLRDAVTVLPFMIATIIFVASVFVGSNYKALKLPRFRGATRKTKTGIVCAWIVVLMTIGLSDLHAWWGPVLQIGAFLLGLIVGRFARCEMRPVAGTVLIMFALTIAMLMQPEFFRFGQLGALTPVHLLALILMAIVIAATVAMRNVRPRGIIRHSAYVKLKWLLRFITALCMGLFVMTESVPVYLGMMVVMFVMFAMSVAHQERLAQHLDEIMFAITLMVFGIITTMPVLTALGIVYYVSLPHANVWQQLKFLL